MSDPRTYDYSQPTLTCDVVMKGGITSGVVYPSVRRAGGECVGVFYPDLVGSPVQGRHLDYHWDGERVDLYREPSTGAVFRIVD